MRRAAKTVSPPLHDFGHRRALPHPGRIVAEVARPEPCRRPGGVAALVVVRRQRRTRPEAGVAGRDFTGQMPPTGSDPSSASVSLPLVIVIVKLLPLHEPLVLG